LWTSRDLTRGLTRSLHHGQALRLAKIKNYRRTLWIDLACVIALRILFGVVAFALLAWLGKMRA